MDYISQIEKRLWSAADRLRANSVLSSDEYFVPIMGLIFLRHGYSRFQKVKSSIEEKLPSRSGVQRPLTKEDFSQRSAIFLPKKAQFPYLVAIPDGEDRARKIVDAMEAIEHNYSSLNGALPKQEYTNLSNDDLGSLLRTFNDPELENVDGDVFGRIYEYFLTKFAKEKAHDGGEFFTPPSIVQTIVNIIEPSQGKIIDPACGSGGMFVQSAHFIEQKKVNPNEQVTFYGVEKNSTTIRLAKMNLVVHGLEGNIQQAISYYEDPHDFIGEADFVMANPPFNVDEIDAERIKTDSRLSFGLPGVNKEKKIVNGNYIWISFFHAYLSEHGRAGIVMSAQSSSAGGEEAKVRRAIIETGDIDVMVAIRSNFFYTRSVPCELWFFDKAKPAAVRDRVLMIDARAIFRRVTRTVFDFTLEQQKSIASIVWLYRGQNQRFVALVAEHLANVVQISTEMPCSNFLQSAEAILEEAVRKATPEASELSGKFKAELNGIRNAMQKIASGMQSVVISVDLPVLKVAKQKIAPMADQAKLIVKDIDQFSKRASALFDGNRQNRNDRKLIKTLDQAKEILKDALKSFCTFHDCASWLLTRFPDAKFRDVEGLVKLVDHAELEANEWVLTPSRYVGVVPDIEDEGFDFKGAMTAIHDELGFLNSEAEDLAKQISKTLQSLAT